MARCLETLCQLRKVSDEDPRVGLPSGLEGLLDTEVDLQGAAAEPAAAAGSEGGRLLELGHLQQVTPEAPASLLAVARNRQLDVVQPAHTSSAVRHAGRGGGGAADRTSRPVNAARRS